MNKELSEIKKNSAFLLIAGVFISLIIWLEHKTITTNKTSWKEKTKD